MCNLLPNAKVIVISYSNKVCSSSDFLEYGIHSNRTTDTATILRRHSEQRAHKKSVIYSCSKVWGGCLKLDEGETVV